MADAPRPDSRVVYRCRACGLEFGVGAVGAVPCPRCGCIGDHERTGALAEATDGGP
ncbi:hypothetical protein [Halosimplex pelagicum]|uniref:Rubrerythrin-like domain-containing protein n=1 Tax=Halosimplex pelagicum TaxID=869886 RepID=A0A7D5PB67_9EURY|nr:hypothetical protein [Halosimplex pelagicum]QLH83464.1 hypothetical protein HZS54_18320 [Halosimplex pelagicum]